MHRIIVWRYIWICGNIQWECIGSSSSSSSSGDAASSSQLLVFGHSTTFLIRLYPLIHACCRLHIGVKQASIQWRRVAMGMQVLSGLRNCVSVVMQIQLESTWYLVGHMKFDCVAMNAERQKHQSLFAQGRVALGDFIIHDPTELADFVHDCCKACKYWLEIVSCSSTDV